MTAEEAETASDEARVGTPEVSAPAPEDDERVRGLIRAELERQHANPLARRTLELLAEAEVEPIAEEPGYRIVDRSGETRLIRDGDAGLQAGSDIAAPMTLRGLVAELRERHPDLFATPPEPEVVDPVPQPPPEPAHDALADVKAAGARFVETQSALARSFAASSAERGRLLAHAASGRFEGWRTRLGERFKAKPAPGPPAATEVFAASETVPPVAEPTAQQAGPAEAGGGRTSEPAKPVAGLMKPAPTFRAHLGDLARRGRDALPVIDRHAVDLRRVAFVGLVVAAGLVVAVAVVVDQGGEGGPSPPGGETSRTETQEASKGPPKAEVRSDPAPAPTPAPKPIDSEAAPEDAEAAPVEEAPRNPNDVVGVPQVIDTATLKLSGKVIHLFGVEWVRGGQADELTKYLRGRTVTCRPASGSSAFLCSVEGRDLSEVVLFNGGGRASSEASPDLVAAEDHARTERLGVWKR